MEQVAKQYPKTDDPQEKEEIESAVDSLSSLLDNDSDLLSEVDQEELPQQESQIIVEATPVSEAAVGSRRLVGKCPVTKVPVYR